MRVSNLQRLLVSRVAADAAGSIRARADKYSSLTASEDLQTKMSIEQKFDFIPSPLLLSVILIASVIGSLFFAGVLGS